MVAEGAKEQRKLEASADYIRIRPRLRAGMACTVVDPRCGPFREDEEMPFLKNWIGRAGLRRH